MYVETGKIIILAKLCDFYLIYLAFVFRKKADRKNFMIRKVYMFRA